MVTGADAIAKTVFGIPGFFPAAGPVTIAANAASLASSGVDLSLERSASGKNSSAVNALQEAVSGLERRHPELSARKVLTTPQAATLLGTLVAVPSLLVTWPTGAGWVLTALLSAGFLGNALFRALLVWAGAGPEPAAAVAAGCADATLPSYSILVPLYREAEMVPALVAALCELDYPLDRLEILIVIEEDDVETRAALAAANLARQFTVLAIPVCQPRTKPKAANYALHFASGDLVVIFDAEDRPERDQLLKAVAAFRAAPDDVVCLQARLNFFNARENWLTRMFALDYALWFDLLLPGLDRLRIPMPLGGTSNHFRIEALRAIGGWDPYNVTEDADLGIRLARLGLRVATLDSTTFEEATVEFGNWLRQRSRWMKGYMQTWLVHMRNPARLLRQSGPGGFLGFQLFVAGTFVTALLNPVLALLFLAGAACGPGWIPAPLMAGSGAGLVAGYALFTWLAMLGPYRRGWLELCPYGFTAPVYWMLISAAAYRGLWQLVRDPWHWEKTQHGRSRLAPLPG